MRPHIQLFIFSLLATTGLLLPGCGFSVYSQTPSETASPAKQTTSDPKPGLESEGVLVVYPRPGSTINAASTFLIGRDNNIDAPLFLNGELIKKNAQGFFAQVTQLSQGENELNITRSAGQKILAIKVNRPAPLPELPATELKILSDSLSPAEDIGVTAGDIIPFSLRATPGCKVRVNLDGKFIELKQLSSQQNKTSSLNLGQTTAFGRVYQSGTASSKDIYFGYYKVSVQDHFRNLKPIYILASGEKSISIVAKNTISVVDQPILLRTVKNDTITRTAPDAARLTPQPEDILFVADGWRGSWWRLELSPGHHIWIAKKDMQPETGLNRPPYAKVTTINLESDKNACRLVIPLSEKLPFQIQQELKPNKVILRLYGAVADTDFVTPDIKAPDTKSLAKCQKVIDYLSFKQPADGLYELTTNLREGQQWGYWADYEGTNLVLHIKVPPPVALDSDPNSPLHGLRICLDPGHGGLETGSMGCSGVRESSLNLAITLKLKDILEKMGAEVILTRTSDDHDISLDARVTTALANQCHLLVSIHNNALPDGRDPWQERGTSTYWYHPQSLALARALKDACIKSLDFPDYGVRYQNLFLCRPSQLPAALVEVGFMINPDEYAELLNQKVQLRAAQGIAQGIKNFVLSSIPNTNNGQRITTP